MILNEVGRLSNLNLLIKEPGVANGRINCFKVIFSFVWEASLATKFSAVLVLPALGNATGPVVLEVSSAFATSATVPTFEASCSTSPLTPIVC